VRRAADEIDLAVAQRFVSLVDGVNQLERDIEPFGLEETELDRGLGNEIGRRKCAAPPTKSILPSRNAS